MYDSFILFIWFGLHSTQFPDFSSAWPGPPGFPDLISPDLRNMIWSHLNYLSLTYSPRLVYRAWFHLIYLTWLYLIHLIWFSFLPLTSWSYTIHVLHSPYSDQLNHQTWLHLSFLTWCIHLIYPTRLYSPDAPILEYIFTSLHWACFISPHRIYLNSFSQILLIRLNIHFTWFTCIPFTSPDLPDLSSPSLQIFHLTSPSI